MKKKIVVIAGIAGLAVALPRRQWRSRNSARPN